jgi:hypothetical protein
VEFFCVTLVKLYYVKKLKNVIQNIWSNINEVLRICLGFTYLRRHVFRIDHGAEYIRRTPSGRGVHGVVHRVDILDPLAL